MSKVYSKLDTALTSGDAEDYAKILITAPDKPLVDIEINSTDAFCDYTVKIPMSHGVDSLNVAAAAAVAFWELRIR